MKRNPFDDYVWWFGESPVPAWAERLAQWTVEIGSPHAGYGNVAQRGTRSANDGACERPCARQGALKPDPTTRSARIGDVFQLGPRRLFAAIRPIPRFLLDYWKAMPCGLALTDELHRLHRRKRHLPVASRICDSVQGNDVRGVPRVQRRLFTAESEIRIPQLHHDAIRKVVSSVRILVTQTGNAAFAANECQGKQISS
jgi:hypothetical protein